jgi:deazaflavin-dependent oxidoreductase (nitroreductase family)
MAKRNRVLGTILKHTLNRLTTRIANSGRGPFSIVRHIGRKSGTTYETPIIVQPTDGGFMVELTYGPDVDWYRNVVAADGCVIRYKGRDYSVHGIEPVDAVTGIGAFSPLQRRLLSAIHRTHFVRFLVPGTPDSGEKD